MTRVWVFFYGSYMNPKVLGELGLAAEPLEPARLGGYRIVIEPRANLVPSDLGMVYGVNARAAHDELERLYAHARDVLGESYWPEAVLTEKLEGGYRPALCYLCHDMKPSPPDPAYVDRILAPAREHGFPEGYVSELESFKTKAP